MGGGGSREAKGGKARTPKARRVEVRAASPRRPPSGEKDRAAGPAVAPAPAAGEPRTGGGEEVELEQPTQTPADGEYREMPRGKRQLAGAPGCGPPPSKRLVVARTVPVAVAVTPAPAPVALAAGWCRQLQRHGYVELPLQRHGYVELPVLQIER
eukprot:gene53401-3239_t